MTDTPRTDGNAGFFYGHGVKKNNDLAIDPSGPFVLASFARQIERELADSKAREAMLAEAIEDIACESQNYQHRGDERDHATFQECIDVAESALAKWKKSAKCPCSPELNGICPACQDGMEAAQ